MRFLLIVIAVISLSGCGGGGNGVGVNPPQGNAGPQSFSDFVFEQLTVDENGDPIDIDVLQLQFDIEDDETALDRLFPIET